MIVGAVINKPVDVATAGNAAPVANTTGMIQQPLPPGMIAISHQAVAAGAPIQIAPQQSSQNNPTATAAAAGNNAAAAAAAANPTAASIVDSASAAVAALSLANTKEKTPMCLINELARFNKVSLL